MQKFFSCVDVYKGFTNIELNKNSSFLTTMHTPIGRYRWLRMPFGVRLGPEEYQRRQHEVLEGLVGVVNKADGVRATVDMNPPQDVKGVQRFLGMRNYLSRFTPNLSETVKPLTELTHVDAVWSWSSQHDKAFSSAKSAIANATTLKLFNVNRPCVLQVDASDSVTN